MKKLSLFLCFLLCSCAKQSQEIRRSTNQNFYVELLFEVDGIRVYRFYDEGRSKYFASSGSLMSHYTTISRGKAQVGHLYDDDIQTTERK